ncbi:unnamed protein product [Microthlaspi erraticum]|uniref:Uncharacterized protein n=1 Tax=Microthlaspi erraticum TaxID=1685480 RepID=A0A6D2KMI6_9BRAS|nr:unnamed protein product [Microthlaspi erraticum]
MSYRNPNVENPQDQVYPPRYPQQQRPPYQSQGSQFQPRQGYEQRSSYPPKQARSKTKAPTPKPPKGSTKIEVEAKPRRKVRKPRYGRNMKLLFPKELIDENLEGFKERVTRTLKLFPKAVVPRDIHGEIVYPAVNHPPDTHCKEKRLGGSKMPLVSIFS